MIISEFWFPLPKRHIWEQKANFGDKNLFQHRDKYPYVFQSNQNTFSVVILPSAVIHLLFSWT